MNGSPAAGRVLVTGSNRGIGLELVRQYADNGYDVIATCRNPDAATDLYDIARRDSTGSVRVHRLDVTSEPDITTLVGDLQGVPIDILIGNAAVFGGARSRLPDIDWAAWRRVFEVNVLGALRVAGDLRQNVVDSEQRKIVFLSSRSGLTREAKAHQSYIYGSSKAALNSAARRLALDLADAGVITTLVNPGHVQTGIGGVNAPMTPAESVTKVRAVIAGLTPADVGKFLHFDGTELAL